MRVGLLSALLLIAIALPARAAAADTIVWSETPPATGDVVGSEVVIEGSGTHHLLTILDPAIAVDSYLVAGSVRFEGVTGPGYLEMWSYFGDGGAYFSRTLAEEGPMAALAGSSSGREFELPFFLNGSPPPDRIEINVVLPEGGTVWIGPLRLQGFGDSDAWWSETQAGVVGAIGGVTAGLLGTALGILGGKRARRQLTRTILFAALVVGAVLIVVALTALVLGQPRHVWYPLGLMGAIVTGVSGLLIPRLKAATQQEELHRIRALDA